MLKHGTRGTRGTPKSFCRKSRCTASTALRVWTHRILRMAAQHQAARARSATSTDQSTSRANFVPLDLLWFVYFVYFGIENIDQHADAKYTKNDKLWFRRYANDLTYAYTPKVQTPLQPEGYKTTVFPMKRATEKRIPSPNLPQLRKAITSTALFSIGIATCPIKKMQFIPTILAFFPSWTITLFHS